MLSEMKLAIALLLSLHSMASADALRLVSGPNSPPFVMTDNGKVTGVTVDIVKTAMERSHVSYEIEIFPLVRAFEMAKKVENVCFFSLVYTEDRKNVFKMVGPLLEDVFAAYGRKESSIRLSSADDLSSYRVGAIQGEIVTSFLQRHGVTVEAVTAAESDLLNLEKLQVGRIDFWVSNKLRADFLLKSKKYEDIREYLVLENFHSYMGCNKEVPDEVVDKLNLTLKRMKEDGTIKEIAIKYDVIQ